MIPKLQARGKSFKGLATYLTHDPKEMTDERVAWTHTHNLTHDHILSAVDEMYWTAEHAELLKQEAGVRAGGRRTDNTVKHFSLNFAPGDDPTQEQITKTAEEFLRHMKWEEHQAIFVAHNDKEYAHVHVMLNAIHPETGLRLNEDFEFRRAQAWALEYERQNGKVHCEQRLKNAEEREGSMTRPAWIAFKENQREFERAENKIRENGDAVEKSENDSNIAHFSDWKKLKEIQRHEREAFFAEGKLAFSELRREIYKEIRGEFRERWADYYAQQKAGIGPEELATAKRELVAEQKERLDGRRKEAFGELRASRDGEYRELLEDQRDTRHDMRARQEAGLDNKLFLELIGERDPHRPATDMFREVSREVATRGASTPGASFDPDRGHRREDNGRMRSAGDAGASIATGLGFGLLDVLGGIADGIVGSRPPPKPRTPLPANDGPSLFDIVTEDSRKQQTQRDLWDADEEWRKRQERSRGD